MGFKGLSPTLQNQSWSRAAAAPGGGARTCTGGSPHRASAAARRAGPTGLRGDRRTRRPFASSWAGAERLGVCTTRTMSSRARAS
eukprot:CAMPEP_0194734544 /NCGR_PEP_ID=MMETSP0296-20130528/70087_1 /TAXON_ID=39354 /ORGANISM="Heterosigma akashiwo, Strain CCMP2393" /LENGTH=84 /DNA_ID=CAMNT_0039643385 /DNA_START=91 /DNA_END=345 /DNA_ORIENTATION=-